jgi:acyl transferase domain-containing protein
VTASRPEPIAIIGIGCLFPKAPDPAAYWSNILHRRDAITDVPETHWSAADYLDADPKAPDRVYAAKGGFLDPVPFPALEFGITPQSIEATDTTQLLGLMVAKSALEDAGFGAGKDFDRSRVSVILGVTGAMEAVVPLGARLGHPHWRRAMQAAGIPGPQAEDAIRRISDSYVTWREDSFPGLLGNVAAGRIANRLDLHGTNCVVDAACASSLAAVHLALLELQSGRSDLALTGGMDTFNDVFMYTCFSKTPALSPRGHARPFDAGADGTTLGEGLGVLVLKRLSDARRDGDRVYATIAGMGSSSDGKGNAVYAPAVEGQVRALKAAHAAAGVAPETIELVEAHGTGTKVGDAVEAEALVKTFGEAGAGETWCALGSVKGQIGHTKAAAGVAGLIKAALALHRKVLPPTVKVEEPIAAGVPGRSPFYVSVEPRPWLPKGDHPRRAGVSSFGFGGSNFHCVLEEASATRESTSWDGEMQILAFSGEDGRELEKALAAAPDPARDWSAFRRFAGRSRLAFRPNAPARLGLVVGRDADWAKLKESAKNLISGKAKVADGVFFARGPAAGRLAFLFPGQGSQYVGMGRNAALHFPEMLEELARADEAARKAGLPGVSERIYPLPAFDAATKSAHSAALNDTAATQPALGAVEAGWGRILSERFGLRPDATAGHSFGELTALWSAGRINRDALAILSRERGRIVGSQSGGGGGMLAVMAEADRVCQALDEAGISLTVANRNAPQQVVLAGLGEAIGNAERLFSTKGWGAKRLPVSAAFHSPDVAGAVAPYREELARGSFGAGACPVYANRTAAAYPDDPDAARDLLASQLDHGVDFVGMIERMYEDGVRTFVEVGPGTVLTGLVGAILGGRDHAAIAIDARGNDGVGLSHLAAALARAAVLGHPVDLTRWDEGHPTDEPAGKPTLTVPICGANAKPKPSTSTKPPVPAPVAAEKPLPSPSPRPARDHSPRIPDPAPAAVMNGDHHSAASPLNGNGHHGTPRVAPASAPAQSNGHAYPPTSASAPSSPEALRLIQEGLATLQRMADQTAQLHRQFLEGQDRTRQTFESLLLQPHQVVRGGGYGGSPAALPAAVAPTVSAHVPARPAPPAPALVATPTRVAVEARAATRPLAPAPQSARPAPAPMVVPVAVAQAVAVKPAPAASPIRDVVLEVVAEKTGYPAELLDLDQELDSDLGIDSIKRVEILSAVQERLPEAPEVKPEDLGSLRTLRDVIGSLDRIPAGATTSGPAPAAPARPSGEAQGILLAVVAEKTGYPAEMLDLDQQLDADLGIDSIKRVEILSAVQERLPNAPEVKPEDLGTLRTLRHVLEYLQGADAAITAAAPAAPGVVGDVITATLMEVVAEKTGYPAELLNLDQQLDSDLGIDSIKRVEILSAVQERLPAAPEVKPEDLGSLRTLRQVVEFLTGGEQPRPPAAPAPQAQAAAAVAPAPAGPEEGLTRLVVASVPLDAAAPRERLSLDPAGEVWVTADGTGLAEALAARLEQSGRPAKVVSWSDALAAALPDRLSGLVVIAPPTLADPDGFLLDAFRLARRCGGFLRKASGSVFATVSRLDGRFGCVGLPASAAPESGGLAGLAKSAGQEWPEVAAKAIDLDAEWGDTEAAASALAEEVITRGPVEVGIHRSGRVALALRDEPITGGTPAFGRGDVAVVTGGARGVTAETAVGLAKAFGVRLLLLGRTPLPEEEPAWLQGLADEAAIKRALADQARGEAISPAAIGERCRGILAAREVRETLARIARAGGEARYRAADARDADRLREIFDEVRRDWGPIRGVVHGAGVLADRLILDKTDDQFRRVYETKVGGLRAILAVLRPDEGQSLVFFSSSTARFGRTGQADYSVANEVLNKIARRESRKRSGRVVAINWGPWDGGMVNAGLKAVFAKEGIGLIPREAGADLMARELMASGGPAEIVVLEGMPEALGLKKDQPAAVSAPRVAPVIPAIGGNWSDAYRREASVAGISMLESHVVDGQAVLPLVLMMEWMAHAALHGEPGLLFHGFDDLRVHNGLFLSRDASADVRVQAGPARRERGRAIVPVRLISGPERIHATAEAVLAAELPAGGIHAGLVDLVGEGPRT